MTLKQDPSNSKSKQLATISATMESLNQEQQEQQEELTLEILRTFYALGVPPSNEVRDQSMGCIAALWYLKVPSAVVDLACLRPLPSTSSSLLAGDRVAMDERKSAALAAFLKAWLLLLSPQSN
jgi:hypothetical protein